MRANRFAVALGLALMAVAACGKSTDASDGGTGDGSPRSVCSRLQKLAATLTAKVANCQELAVDPANR